MSSAVPLAEVSNVRDFPGPKQAKPVKNFPAWVKRSTVGLKIEANITIQQWLSVVENLERTGRGYQWQHGDALNEGEARFGEDYAQAIDPEEEEQREQNSGETYRKYMQVASRIKPGNRLPELTWTHHLKVAFLESEEEIKYWLQRAADEKLSVRALEKAMKKARKGLESEEDGISDLEILQDPEVRAWLDGYRVLLNEIEKSLPIQASYLRSMVYKHREQVVWQLERTLAGDCRVVKKAVALMLGSDDEVFTCLQTRGYFLSNPDLDDRLDLLVELGQVKKKQAEGRKKGQKGKMVDVYLPCWDTDEDDEPWD